MKMTKAFQLATLVAHTTAVIIVGSIITQAAAAQDPCGDFPSYVSPPSNHSRTITLSKYRIRFRIPENYRTIGYGDSVGIFSPESYQYYQCLVTNQLPGGELDVSISVDNESRSFDQLRNRFHGDLQDVEMIRVGQLQTLRFQTNHAGTLERIYAIVAPCRCRITLISVGLANEESPDSALLTRVLRSFEFF